jgi:hypothetical protein
MAETQQIQATEAHYGLLVDIDRGLVVDRVTALGETPCLLVDGEPAAVAQLVWDLEALGWVWRPADDDRWQLTDEGRAAREDGGL